MERDALVARAERWRAEQIVSKTVESLKRGNLDAVYAPTRQDALAQVLERIPSGASIGIGDSVTLHEIGFMEWLGTQGAHQVFNAFAIQRDDYPKWEDFRIARTALQQKALTATVFLTGTNAVTLDGRLVNVDGHGNRVAGMAFGPNRVIFVSGYNKIVRNLEEALVRVKDYCAPLNAKRIMGKHRVEGMEGLPCLATGQCSDCRNINKLCRITMIIDGWSPLYHSPDELPPSVIIVGEALGI